MYKTERYDTIEKANQRTIELRKRGIYPIYYKSTSHKEHVIQFDEPLIEKVQSDVG